jgi:hypothetical protein
MFRACQIETIAIFLGVGMTAMTSIAATAPRQPRYVAGINAEKQSRTVKLNLGELSARGGTLISDRAGGNLSFRQETVRIDASNTFDIALSPRGGFVLTAQ